MGDRLLCIGLDGGTWNLIVPFAQRGLMPNMAGLMERGAWGTLRSTVPPVTAPAWTSFLTGKNPGNHGIYQFFSFNPLAADSLGMGQRSYLSIPGIVVNSSKIPGAKLWNLIDRGGLRQVQINVPMAWPPEPLNGVMVTGMLTPPGSTRMTWPPELAARMTDYEIDLDPKEKEFSGDDRQFLRRVGEQLEKRLAWSLKLMGEEAWSFFTVVFTETDRLQHRFYDLLDPETRGAASAERQELVPLLEELYRRVDAAVGELVRAAGEGTRLMILSDHGFGPAQTELVDLRALGGLVGVSPPMPAADHRRHPWWWKFRITKGRLYRYLGFLPAAWLRAMEAAWRRRQMRRQPAILFKMHENVGGVWISLRNAAGAITDSAAHEKLVRDIKVALACVQWKGREIVSAVYRRENLYHGPYLDGAPDLIFILEEHYGILEADQGGARQGLVVAAPADRPRKKGTHRMEGIWLLAGEGIRPGRSTTASIEDTTPTILHLLGLAVPDDMDGRVITAACEEAFLAAHPVVKASASTEAARPGGGWAGGEEEAIKERLREIGYFD